MTPKPVVGFNGELWAFSQTHAWSSTDGVQWTHQRKTDWGERIGQAFAFFDNRMWMFGGLSYADRVPLNDVWSSEDGSVWTAHGNAGWAPRTGHAIAVFQDKLWVFGGADQVRHDFVTMHARNDVWSSDDGVHWTQRTAAAPWSAREEANVVVHDGVLYLIGGTGRADIWTSSDGLEWSQRTTEAAWGGRHGYGTAVFADKLWVYGGWRGAPTNCLNDLWYSADGERWVQQAEHAPWTPRSPRTIVYDDKLWIFSGKHTGATDNWGGDIWTLTLFE